MARNTSLAAVTLAAALAFSAPPLSAQDAPAPDQSRNSELIASIYAHAGKLAALGGILFQGTQRMSVWQTDPAHPAKGQWRDCPELGHFTIALDGIPYTRTCIRLSPLVMPSVGEPENPFAYVYEDFAAHQDFATSMLYWSPDSGEPKKPRAGKVLTLAQFQQAADRDLLHLSGLEAVGLVAQPRGPIVMVPTRPEFIARAKSRTLVDGNFPGCILLETSEIEHTTKSYILDPAQGNIVRAVLFEARDAAGVTEKRAEVLQFTTMRGIAGAVLFPTKVSYEVFDGLVRSKELIEIEVKYPGADALPEIVTFPEGTEIKDQRQGTEFKAGRDSRENLETIRGQGR